MTDSALISRPAERPTPKQGKHPLPSRWTILALVSVGQSLASLVGLAVLPLAPFIQAEWMISRAQVGLLISALYVGALLSSIPSGWLADAAGSRAMLVLSQIVIGVAILLVSFAPGFGQALLLMPLVGLGYGALNPMTSKAVMLWFTGHIRGTAMSIKQTGFALGGALGALTLPSIALAGGWRLAMAVGASLILASAAIGAWLYAEPAAADARRGRWPGLARTYSDLLRNRDLMILVATGIILAAVQLIVTGYLVLFLAEVIRLPVVVAGAMLSITQISGAIGRIAWGAASDRLTRGRRRPVLLALAVSIALTTMLVSLLSVDSPLWLVATSAALLGATAVAWNGVFAALTSELAGLGSVAGATGLATGANFLGVMLGPPAFGLVVDLTGSYHLAWRLAAAASLLNVGGLLLVREHAMPSR